MIQISKRALHQVSKQLLPSFGKRFLQVVDDAILVPVQLYLQ
jgi:hypothetical protein